jgi:hypothetical protein
MSSAGSGRYRGDAPDLLNKIKELEKRLERVESNPRIGSTTIDRGDLIVDGGNIIIRQGRLVVENASGQETIRVGLLADGSYDLSAVDIATGQEVHLAALAFGAQHSYDTNNCATTSATYADPNVSGSAGPAVTVLVGSSRRVKVTFSGLIVAGFGNPKVQNGGNISVDISGASTIAANDDWQAVSYHQLQVTVGNGPALDQIQNRAASVHFFGVEHGLNAGLNTFTLKYRCSGGGGQQADFADRLILVEPY